MSNWKSGIAGLGLFAAFAVLAIGCGDQPKTMAGKTVAKADAKHDGWWCDEHGIPEAECSMCSAAVAKECKAKGDWCEKHDRAKTQCFLCDPKLKDKYTAQYKAKLGKEPPPTEDEEKAKKGK